MGSLHEKDNNTGDGQRLADVAEPEAVLGGRRGARLLAALVHPHVGEAAADLLADDGAQDEGQELQADLLGVELVLFGEDLRDLDGRHDVGPQEDHRVRDGREQDHGLGKVHKRVVKVAQPQGVGVDAPEAEVALLEMGRAGLNGKVAAVQGLGAQEQVQHELHKVGDGEDEVDPAVVDAQRDEAEQERRDRHADGDHDGPRAHKGGALRLEEHLGDDGAADGRGGADEEGRDGPAEGDRAVRMTETTADISNHTADQRNKKYGSSSVYIGDRSP